MRRFIMACCSFFFRFLCALSLVSPPHTLTKIRAGLTEFRHEVGWILSLNVYSASGDAFLPVVRADRDQTRHRLSRPSVVSPLGRTLSASKIFFKTFMAAATNPSSHMLRLPSLLYAHPLI